MTKILILANHYPVASGRYMRDAFRRVGCDTRTMGNEMGNEIWGLHIPDKYVWPPQYLPGQNLGFWEPDLILQMDTEVTYANTVCPDVPHAIYSVDNHVRRITSLGRWDHQFLAHHAGPAQPVCDCQWNTYLPCAYDPSWFTPSPIPMHDRIYDVAI